MSISALFYISTLITLFAVIFQLKEWRKSGYKDFSWLALWGGLIGGVINLVYMYYTYIITDSFAGVAGGFLGVVIALYIMIVKYLHERSLKNKKVKFTV